MNADYGGLAPEYVDAVRGFEGWNPSAYGDGPQTSIGYGTKALHPNEVIDKAEGERRLNTELTAASQYVDGVHPNIPEGARAALTSLTYNAGPGWIKYGLGDAVRQGDWAGAAAHLQQYNHADGAVSDGLTKRRQTEAGWMGASDSAPMAMAFAGNNNKMAGYPPRQAAQPDDDQGALGARFMSGGPGALFGAPNGILKNSGGSDGYDLGYGLQGAGAGLIAINNPAGGAALQTAANAPFTRARFSVTKDALGNSIIVNNHTGAIWDGNGRQVNGSKGAVGGADGAPDAAGTLASSPVAMAERAKNDQETSSKTMDALRDSAVSAQQLKDKANEMLELTNNPNIRFGGFGDMTATGKNIISGISGGTLAPAGTDESATFSKNAAQMQGLYLGAQKGVRFAGPEIKFSELANADLDKPRATNQQILNDTIRQADNTMAAYQLGLTHMKTHGVLGPQFGADLTSMYGQNPSSKLDPGMAAGGGKRPSLSTFDKR